MCAAFPQLPWRPTVWAWRKDSKDGLGGLNLLNQEPREVWEDMLTDLGLSDVDF